MERLTEWDKNNDLLVKEEEQLLDTNGLITKDEMYKIMRHLAEKLAEYEDTGLTPSMVRDLIKMNKKHHKSALENAHLLDDYQEIGTIEECRIAVGKMKPKKPVVKYGCTYRCPPDCGGAEFDEYGDVYHCPTCDREISYSLDDVCRCGQIINWRK